MANITVNVLPHNKSSWVRFAKNHGIENPGIASIHTYDHPLQSGSKIGDIGFALQRVVWLPTKLPFSEGKRSRPNSDLIVPGKFIIKARPELPRFPVRENYLHWIEDHPYERPIGPKADKLGRYQPVLESQQLTRGLPDNDDHDNKVDYSPMITRIKARQLAEADMQEARLQSFQLHSNLGLRPQTPEGQPLQTQMPETPTRRGIRSPDDMEMDWRSQRMHSVSSSSTVEQQSPLTSEAGRLQSKIPGEPEVVIAGTIFPRTTTSHFDEFRDISWKPTRKSYTMRNPNGEKIFTAAVDGHVEVRGVAYDTVTLEMKKNNRSARTTESAAFRAQVTCQMTAVICNLPGEIIEKVRRRGRPGKHISISMNKNEYWLDSLDWPVDWADYIRGKPAPFALAKVTEVGPYTWNIRDLMDEFQVITIAINYTLIAETSEESDNEEMESDDEYEEANARDMEFEGDEMIE